jgi:hypothetical protein
VHPYAVANAQIQSAPADVVIVDHVDDPGFDPGTLVRNDPFLARRPKVLQLADMDEAMVRQLCAGYAVMVFDGRNAQADGIDIVHYGRPAYLARLRQVIADLHCGQRMPLKPPA